MYTRPKHEVTLVEEMEEANKGAMSSQDNFAGSDYVPADRIRGLMENWNHDLTSGFILFLIALPLSVAVAAASGFPPMAGLFSAIIGGMIVSQLSGSYVTINGWVPIFL